MAIRFFFPAFLLFLCHSATAQHRWGLSGGNPTALFSTVIECWCPECNNDDFIGATQYDLDQGCTVTPNGNLFGMDDYNDIWQINTSTGAFSLAIDLPHSNTDFDLIGLAAGSNNIFYSINRVPPTDTLVEINIATGTWTNLGTLTEDIYNLGDMTFFNGYLYYISGNASHGISRITLGTPLINEFLVSIPSGSQVFHTLTATNQCHSLFSFEGVSNQFVIINTLDGDIINVGFNNYNFYGLSSILEYETPACVTSLDLDCNDSSGALNADFNTENYYCFTDDGVGVVDYDVLIQYDTLIDQITIELAGTLPDGMNEFLQLEQAYPNLNISGSGTQTILLESDGLASSTQFKAALRQIRYHNTAFIPTPGTRIVNVNAITYYGTATNQGTAFIDLVDWPRYDLELGPDIQACEDEQLVLNTQLLDVDHIWSTNETSQFIIVNEPGVYSVTVTGDEFCANIDSVEVTFVPNAFVQLADDIAICEGEEAYITIEANSPYPLTIEIIASPGGPFTLTGITNDTDVPVTTTGLTYYVINSVTSPLPACIEIGNEIQSIDIIPGYNDTLAVEICEGDSILINATWISDPGTYTEYFTTILDCDSIITYQVSWSNSITVLQESNTCIVSDTGTFIQVINNPSGCDTIIETHVQLGALDTTYVTNTTCRTAEDGIFTNVLTSIDGCDSVVVNTVLLLAPQDTLWLNQNSCDTSALGIFSNIFVNQQGCDSIVITTIALGNPDTTEVFTTSCDSSSLGVFEVIYQNQFLCDSVVITTITYSARDSVFISDNTCNLIDSGVFVNTYSNVFGCDSIVTETISFVPAVYFSYNAFSCDEDETGIFVDTLTGISGCDSIVTKTVNLLPENEIFLTSTTCKALEAGVFVENLINQYGCDSIVTLTVSLIPGDTTLLIYKTCDPAEVGNIENTFINQEGCDSLVIEQTTLHTLPELQTVVTSDFNGYAISCFGEADGSVNAAVTGVPPWTYLWSTGSTDQTITGLSAGSYSVTITDGNGCNTSGEVMLLEPEEFSISFIVSQPDCFDHQEGSIIVEQVGGIEPIRYSIDDVNYQTSPVFDQLSGGTYTITAIDANGCEVKEIIWINVPLMVDVELPDDQIAFPGDTILINAIVNVPFDSLVNVQWSGLNNPDCPNCLTQPVAPIITTTYSVTVTDVDGCSDSDEMTLFLERKDDVFVPNIFSPNGDKINDRLLINVGRDVEEIKSFLIIDRWGNIVFQTDDFQANDLSKSWDGTMKGKELNPGVFAYRIIVGLKGGGENVLYGDVTIVR